MERRQFLSWVSVGALASSLPMVLAACNQTEETAQTTTPEGTAETPAVSEPRTDGFKEFATVQELDEKGKIKNSIADLLIIRNPANNAIVAVNPVCTHQGCSVDWKADAKEFVCPCHSSKFAVDGAVVNGPATQPLGTYEVKEEGGAVLVKVG